MPSYIVLTAIMSLFVPQIGAESDSLHSEGTTFTLVVERQCHLIETHFITTMTAAQSNLVLKLHVPPRCQTLRHNEVTF